MDLAVERGKLQRQLAQTDQQLAQLTGNKFRLEGAIAVYDRMIAEEAAIPKMTEANL